MFAYSLTLNYTVCNGTVRANWAAKPLRSLATKKTLLRLFSRRRRARHWQRRK